MATSINFQNQNQESINFQSETDENDLLDAVEDYIKELNDTNIPKNTPLAQKQPNTVILDFILWYLAEDDTNEDEYTLNNTKTNNHHTYNLNTNTWNKPQRPQ